MARRKRRTRRNPPDHVTYWVSLGMIVVAGVAIWGWKNMSDKQKAAALPT